MPVTIYLDTSVYNRPFDDQSQPRIWLETLAFSVILQLLESGEVKLITSTIVSYETSRNPHKLRRNWVNRIQSLADHHQSATLAIKQRASDLEEQGIKALDALHIASAEFTGATYFITCDDRLIRRYQQLPLQKTIVYNPVEFVRIVTGEYE